MWSGIKKAVFLAAMLALSAGAAQAADGHYVNGVEGIKAATLPPPGVYWRIYSTYYGAGEILDKNGDEIPVNFDLDVLAVANRFLWVTPLRILGGDYFADLTAPLVWTDLDMKRLNVHSAEGGFGDLCVEPFGLAWHGPQYDLSLGAAVYLPTGKYDIKEPASPGKDMYTGMFTFGGTLYADTEKTWSASLLARYETHSEKDETNVEPGDDFHFEWGLAKTLAQTFDVGLAGYCQWQITDDGGTGVTWDDSVHDQAYAIGPEVAKFFPESNTGVSLRALWEFGVEDATQGSLVTLTISQGF